MSIETNNRFANAKLSLDDLDAITGGGFWGDISSALHAIERIIHTPPYDPGQGRPVFKMAPATRHGL